jgi:hypothetical protein
MFNLLNLKSINTACEKTLAESDDPAQRSLSLLALTFYGKMDFDEDENDENDDDDDDNDDIDDYEIGDDDLEIHVKNQVIEIVSNALKDDPDPGVRRYAAWALRFLRNADSEILLQALNDDDHLVHLEAVESLAFIANYYFSNSAVRGLLQALGDNNMAVQMRALYHLVSIRRKLVFDGIDKMLGKEGAEDSQEIEE